MKNILNKEQVLKNIGINESLTMKKGDVYEQRRTIEVPVSLINAFVSKAKKEFNVNVRENYSDVDIVDMVINYVINTFVNIESLPVNTILGLDQKENTELTTTVQDDVQTQVQPDSQTELTTTVQDDVQTQVQTTQEEPIQTQTENTQQI